MNKYPRTPSVHIAVVDDDESILDALEMALEGEGWSVKTYTGGKDFLADLAKGKPDCLILDPHLDGLSGADVAHAVVNRDIRLPIIVLTARPDSPVTAKIIQIGATAMLTKPVKVEELFNHIQAAVDHGIQISGVSA